MCSASADAWPNENFFVFSLSETAVSLNSRYMAGVLIEHPDSSHNISLNLKRPDGGKERENDVGIAAFSSEQYRGAVQVA